MTSRLFLGGAIIVALVAVLPVRTSAHHSFAAEYDAHKPVTLSGTVTKVEWVNPHGWIYVDVKDAKGTIAKWAVETGTPAMLARRGLKKTFLPVGAEIVITGYRAKDGSNTANGAAVKFPDGRDIFLGSSGADVPAR
jgi:DNA/RNA endonuclease YhcR with UshA esterase domain